MVNVLAFLLDSLIWIGLSSILALSNNLQYGYTGLMNFGIAGFVMIGAYISAVSMISGQSFALSLSASAVAAGLMGLLASLPALKLSEDYLAIVTLIFAESIRLVIKNEYWIAGGAVGLRGVPSAIPVEGLSHELFLIGNVAMTYGILFSLCIASYVIVNSPFGRVMRAIREDELAAQSLGKNTFKCKAQVFMVSSAMLGVAGALLSQYVAYVGPELFVVNMTFTAFIMSVIGGCASIKGAVLGAMVVKAIERGMRVAKDYAGLPVDPNNLMFILTGILMLTLLMFKPEGILKEEAIKTVEVTFDE